MSVSIIPDRRPIEAGFQDGEVTVDVYFTGLSQDDVQVSITSISGPEQEWYLDSETDITPAGLPEGVYWKRFVFAVPINDTGTEVGDGENYEAAFFFSAGGVTESVYCIVYPYDVAYGIEPTIIPSPIEIPQGGGTVVFTGSSDLGDTLEAFSLAGVFPPTFIGTQSWTDEWDTNWTYYYFQVSASGPTDVGKTDYIYVVPRVDGTVEDYWAGTKVKAYQSGSSLSTLITSTNPLNLPSYQGSSFFVHVDYVGGTPQSPVLGTGLTLNSVSQSGNHYIYDISASDNDTTSTRTLRADFSCVSASVSSSDTLIVYQPGQESWVRLANNLPAGYNFNVGNQDPTFSVEVQYFPADATIPAPVTSSGAYFLYDVSSSDTVASNIRTRRYTWQVDPWPGSVARSGSVTFPFGDNSTYCKVTQQPPVTPTVPPTASIVSDNPENVPSGSSTVVAEVLYAGEGTPQEPYNPSDWVTLQASASWAQGIRYAFSVDPNPSISPRTASITFINSAGDNVYDTDTLRIQQAGVGAVSPSISASNDVNIGFEAGTFQTTVLYTTGNVGAFSRDVVVGDSWITLQGSSSTPTPTGESVVYTFRATENTATDSRDSNIVYTVSIAGSPSLSKIQTVHQAGQAAARVVSATGGTVGSSVTASSYTAEYELGDSSLDPSTPTFTGGAVLQNTTLVSSVGTRRVYRYDVSFPANTDYNNAKTYTGTFSIGSSTRTATITQQVCTDLATVIRAQSLYNIGSGSTTLTIPVYYEKVLGTGNIITPGRTSGVQSVSGSFTTNYPDVTGSYTVAVSANTSTSERTERITWRASGSSGEVNLSTDIRQAGRTPTVEGITPEWSSKTVNYATTRIYIDVTYAGITDGTLVGSCTSNVSGWTATPVSSEAVGGNFKVTWALDGTRNTGQNSRTITYTFTAVGGRTATAAVIQNGIGSGTDRGIKAAWRNDTEVEVYDSTIPVEAYSGSRVLFSDYLYPSPGLEYANLNVGRLAEPYMEARDFPETTRATALYPITVDYDGSSDTFWFVDDWSYDENSYPHLEYSLSKPYQDIVAVGQYMVYSVLRTADTYAGAVQYGLVGSYSSVTPGLDKYQDVVKKVSQCGNYRVVADGIALASWESTGLYKWVIYYYNKYAGWDSFVIKGPVVPGEKTTPERYLLSRRNFKTYQVGASETFRVNTGTLTDRESQAIAEIITSPSIVLHDLENDKLVNVTCNSTSVEKKTFRNQGRTFANYTLEFESNLSRIRR